MESLCRAVRTLVAPANGPRAIRPDLDLTVVLTALPLAPSLHGAPASPLIAGFAAFKMPRVPFGFLQQQNSHKKGAFMGFLWFVFFIGHRGYKWHKKFYGIFM